MTNKLSSLAPSYVRFTSLDGTFLQPKMCLAQSKNVTRLHYIVGYNALEYDLGQSTEATKIINSGKYYWMFSNGTRASSIGNITNGLMRVYTTTNNAVGVH